MMYVQHYDTCFDHIMWSRCDEKRSIHISLGPIQWKVKPRIIISSDNNKEYITIDIECNYDYQSSNLWNLNAHFGLRISHRTGAQVNTSMDCYFDPCSKSYNFGKLIAMEHFISSKDTCEQFSELFIKVGVGVDSISGIQQFIKSRFATKEDSDYEVALTFGQRKYDTFYVNKYGLIAFSPVLSQMLSNNQKELNFEIKDFAYFLKILHFIYVQKPQLKGDDAEGVLELAVKYEFEFIILEVEEFLISTKEVTNENNLRIAELYGLSKLQVIALEKISTDKKLEGITKENIRMMSNETINANLLKLCI